jgi:hypothetical protein
MPDLTGFADRRTSSHPRFSFGLFRPTDSLGTCAHLSPFFFCLIFYKARAAKEVPESLLSLCPKLEIFLPDVNEAELRYILHFLYTAVSVQPRGHKRTLDGTLTGQNPFALLLNFASRAAASATIVVPLLGRRSLRPFGAGDAAAHRVRQVLREKPAALRRASEAVVSAR